ncbi:MAG: hypothetical protein IKC53_08350, partial [Lentisphaeria bacterium]|nr:hypothetical protein [Lentisphaeria bacterium]
RAWDLCSVVFGAMFFCIFPLTQSRFLLVVSLFQYLFLFFKFRLGPSVGMHSTGAKLFSVPVCGSQNDGFRPRIRQLGGISFGNLTEFHSAT